MSGKPVRLTVPAVEPGLCKIMADGKRTGFILAEFRGWRAVLFPVASALVRPAGSEEVTGKTLGDLRAVLRERVERDGPWWK